MGIILDILIVLIVGYVIFSNARRGFGKVLVFCIGYLVSTFLASLISSAAAPVFYDGVARDSNINAVQTANEHIDFAAVYAKAINDEKYGFIADSKSVSLVLQDYNNGNFDDRLYEFVVSKVGSDGVNRTLFDKQIQEAFIRDYGKELGARVPEYVITDFEKSVRANPKLMRDIMYAYYDKRQTAEERAAKIEEMFSEAPTTEVLQIFLYLILFSVCMVLAAVIATMLQNKLFFNIRKSTDHAMGGFIACSKLSAWSFC